MSPNPTNQPVFSDGRRRPGFGDHVCMCGGYLGIIVEVWHDGLCTVAKRSRSGLAVVETEGVPLDSLHVSPITPICATETRDPDWRRV